MPGGSLGIDGWKKMIELFNNLNTDFSTLSRAHLPGLAGGCALFVGTHLRPCVLWRWDPGEVGRGIRPSRLFLPDKGAMRD